MFLSVHTAAGIFIGKQIPNPFLAFMVGFFSHFIVDMVPHGDDELNLWLEKGGRRIKIRNVVGLDIALSSALVSAAISRVDIRCIPSILAAAFGSVLPDLVWWPWKIFEISKEKLLFKFVNFHHNLQEKFKRNVSFKYGFAFQVLTLIGLALLIF
ncbi:hypothetical protein KKD19_03500 [Patescibacteria group bacterium]|nr:hypothetical protein [Patescibacteria group bacterium]MBU4512279.1 hypothetical protein [Patescibacteria group bacterium]MCG2693279.1 hypothetical protein [Candidatus Parcubacteria bacterium]